ncbi:Triosephosphate isomerase [Trichinella spiralis]|uniref:Triosephosphate isomerase n=1 Tax=Trichinella spiralis TaxID=6334 RepID=A0ABR3KWF2_TRISP
MTILSDSFGRKEIIIEKHMKELQNFPTVTSQWDTNRLSQLANQLEVHVRGLEALQTPAEAYQAFLMPKILPRLPRELAVEWKRKRSEKRDNVQELLAFLKAEILIGERHGSLDSSTKSGSEIKKPITEKKIYPEKKYTMTASHASIKQACNLCQQDHQIWNCSKFLQMNIVERQEHHHPVLHPEIDNQEKGSTQNQHPPTAAADAKIQVGCVLTTGRRSTLLQTARARLHDSNGNSMLRGPMERVFIESLGGDHNKCKRTRRVKFWISSLNGKDDEKQLVEALCLPKICQKPKLVPNVNRLKHLTALQLADDFTENSGAFDVLIDLDYYYEFVDHKIKRGKKGEPVAVHSTLGWIICGPMTNEKRELTSFSHFVKVLYAKVDEQLDKAIRKFWEIETIGIMDDSDKADVDSTRAVQSFESTLQFDGIRYTENCRHPESNRRLGPLTLVELQIAAADTDRANEIYPAENEEEEN